MNTIASLNDSIWLDTKVEQSEHQIPIDIFPIQVQTIIQDYQRCMNYPVEFTTASILALTSVTMGNSVQLQVHSEWYTTAIIYLLMVQNRGHSKSHPMRDIFKYLFLKDKEFKEIYDSDKKQYLRDIENFRIQRKKEKVSADSEPEEPIRQRTHITKFTPEVLYKIHADNPKGLIVWSDEAKSWFGSFNQYSKNADEQLWCTIWNGGHLSRETISHGGEFIPKAFVSILGGIQPDEIIDFIKENTNNGLVDRILFSYPEYLKVPKWAIDELPMSTTMQLKNIYENMYRTSIYTGIDKIDTIKYSDEAKKIVIEWNNKKVDEVNSEPNNITYQGIITKAKISVHRLAMIIEKLICACDNKPLKNISVTSVTGAIKLIEYFINEALKIRNLTNKSSVETVDIWYNFLSSEFTTSDALLIAKKLRIRSKQTVFNWIEKDKRILKVEHGKYTKLI